ncbi:sortilin-related receptor-like isoform X8 [Culex pipiens pallens]|uniref:sortilin-related receptor-like isoform X8 n=1 Tax=Culex pipiens pallens TaxID=42434 RepID=UPI0022AA819B|nr:sortilin-related receptor-like isoform X8 [Culex pipiens pallens]
MGSETRILGGGRLTVVVVLLLSTSIIGIQSINSQHYYDTDLVFDDSSTIPSKASKPNTATNLVNDDEERLFDLGASNDQPAFISDDDIEAANDYDEDETPEEEAYENDEMRAIAAAPQDESQNWLVRSVHRIKRSIDNLLSGNDKATKKPKKRKNPKKMVNGSKKVRDSDLIVGKKIGRKNPKSNEEKKSGKPKNVHRSQTGKRRGHEEALRLKRQYDGLADDEDTLSGSGGPLEIESENAYKLTLTVMKPWRQALADKESTEFKQVAREVAGTLHNLLSRLDDEANFIITVLKLERNPDSVGETFITFEINVDKHAINRQTIDNVLRTSIEQGYGQFDMKGYSLISEDCSDDEFSCDQERCIPKSKQCDSHQDCDDGTDEIDCPTEAPPARDCLHDEFSCPDGSCIPSEQKCDGVLDCEHGEDEENCSANPHKCLEDEFQCNDGRCIPNNNVCDGSKHCSDGEDEDCITEGEQCGRHEFSCISDGYCIGIEKRCDRQIDCLDGSDEKGCARCNNGDFFCDNGHCIPMAQRCDHWNQCSDGSDERGCTNSCNSYEFTCDNGDCTDKHNECNGVRDCGDGSDERNCPSRRCNDNEFACNDGSCTHQSNQCNGRDDCPDGSDEHNCHDNSHLKSLDHHNHHNRPSASHHHNQQTPSPARNDRCGPDSFECHDGICIADYKKCNGIVDCHDQSDELHCPYDFDVEEGEEEEEDTCTDDEFFCDGRCLDKRLQCDGRIDCQSGEDEENCPDSNECNDSEFACDEKCIDRDGYCDGLSDCADGTDENNCIICQAGAFHCNSRECIPSSKRCDGTVDCTDSSDEIDCNSNSSNGTSGACNSDQWQCDNGICINSEFRCDSQIDCSDRSDEENCPPGKYFAMCVCIYMYMSLLLSFCNLLCLRLIVTL